MATSTTMNSEPYPYTLAGATFELPISARHEDGAERLEPKPSDSLSGTLLVGNIRWFCQLRWLVAAVLVVVGVLAFLPRAAELLNLRERIVWPGRGHCRR